MNILLTLFLAALSGMAFASPKKVAVVKIIRGTANALTMGKSTLLRAEDWVEDGSIVKTEDKSFVKLVFLDKSTMNVGPNSEMKIEKFDGKDSGVIDLVKGKIRSQVTKDYLQIEKDKSKLFIKTNNAVMGVRGTDFMISTNGTNTATVLFEGEVVFNKLSAPNTTNTAFLEQTVNAGVRIVPGEFSVVDHGQVPTVPSLLNVGQLEKLERNPNFAPPSREPASASTETKSVVPPGLTGEAVSNTSSTLKDAVANVAAPESTPVPAASHGNANGFASADGVKPTNGSFVHIESGIIIPPPAGSVLDPNTNTYIAAPGAGRVAADGSYVPPSNVVITNAGQILVTVVDRSGATVQKEIPKPSPVIAAAPVVNTSVTPAAAPDTSGRAPASVAPAPANSFVAAVNNPPHVGSDAGPGSVFSGGVVGNTQIAPPTAGATPVNNPAETSRSVNYGNYTINVHH